jgi:hypothetical protein
MGDGTFDVIEVIATNIVPAIDAQGLEILVSDDLGVTYETGSNYYGGGNIVGHNSSTPAHVIANAGASFACTGGISNVAAEGGMDFTMTARMAGASTYFSFDLVGRYVGNAPLYASISIGGHQEIGESYASRRLYTQISQRKKSPIDRN